jgi:hypothetical protein
LDILEFREGKARAPFTISLLEVIIGLLSWEVIAQVPRVPFGSIATMKRVLA